MTYFIVGLACFIAGFIIDRYIIPILDVNYELFSIKMNQKATDLTLDTEAMKIEFSKVYGIEEEDSKELIGFNSENSEFQEEDDEVEDEEAYVQEVEEKKVSKCECSCKNKIGFIKA